MNRLEALLARSRYVEQPHLVLQIDGESLDALLSRSAPEYATILAGLVPALLDWLEDAEERAIVWQRVLPASGTRSKAPILMCPDDCDLWCTVIVAEVETQWDYVFWHRLGIDRSARDGLPAAIGTDVEWLAGIGPFQFERQAYEQALGRFSVRTSAG